MTFACTKCGHEADRYIPQCPVCGRGVLVRRAAEPSALVEETNGHTQVSRPVGRLLDPTVPARPPLTSIGLPSLDLVLGGGVALRADAVYIFAGFSGTGKTTAAFRIAEEIPGTLFFALVSEGHPRRWDEIGARTGLARNTRFFFLENVDAIIAEVRATKPPLFLVDQLHAFEESLESFTGPQATMSALRRLVAVVQEVGTTAILLAEREKAGGTLKGLGSMPHKVEATVYFEKRGDAGSIPPNGTALRWVRTDKNRFGVTANLEMVLGPRGWEEPPPPKLDS